MLSSTLQQFLLVFSYTSSPVQPASLPEQPAKQTGFLASLQVGHPLVFLLHKWSKKTNGWPTYNDARKPDWCWWESKTVAQPEQPDGNLWLYQSNTDAIKCKYDFLWVIKQYFSTPQFPVAFLISPGCAGCDWFFEPDLCIFYKQCCSFCFQ